MSSMVFFLENEKNDISLIKCLPESTDLASRHATIRLSFAKLKPKKVKNTIITNDMLRIRLKRISLIKIYVLMNLNLSRIFIAIAYLTTPTKKYCYFVIHCKHDCKASREISLITLHRKLRLHKTELITSLRLIRQVLNGVNILHIFILLRCI